IIEKVTGITYEDYVMEEIIKPCQMSQTHFLIEDYGEYANVTTCYEWNEATDEIYAVEDCLDAPAMRAIGFLKSTVRDIMRYAQLYKNQALPANQIILTQQSIKQL